ncbi:hypothetical protein [Streptomyces canus]|uniref:calcium-binding protein n=1 Tax=Streptomyces canus TaxID=58343 RepID=UPI002DD93386|nr:hypothetical protein [Streptomyces canus]WSD82888.1 hypothetical protein OG925_00275 [Streptomyces canus]WSD91946.1 hypothetical protein OG925_50205 [Streptomyces canus]WSD92565.1 hypothetical protein OG925_50755 [Streptomyces canus]
MHQQSQLRAGRATGTAEMSRLPRLLLAAGGVLALVAATVAQGDVAAAATPQCYGRVVTVWGGPGNDTINTGPGNDVISGGGGSDQINGGGGNDVICGDDGNDYLVGGSGDDLIAGERGADFLKGEAGNDRLRGFQGKDLLWGGPGNDALEGGDGHNWSLNWGDDSLVGGTGADTMRGSAGKDVIDSRVDNRKRDLLFGYAGADRLYARDGKANDVVRGGDGRDFCTRDRGEDLAGC